MDTRYETDDRGLIEACVKKDLAAWSAFTKKYSGLVFAAAGNRLAKCGSTLSPQDIEDIKQNVFALIWKDNLLETVRNRKNISCWLAVVSGNIAITYARKKRLEEPEERVSIFDKINGRELGELISCDRPNPTDEFAKNELAGRIEKAFKALPVKERLAIKLNLLHGKEYREIALILHVPVGTVSSRIKRAKEKLRKALRDYA